MDDGMDKRMLPLYDVLAAIMNHCAVGGRRSQPLVSWSDL